MTVKVASDHDLNFQYLVVKKVNSATKLYYNTAIKCNKVALDV